MATVTSTFWRDGNGVPITTAGLTTINSLTFTGSNATVATSIFRITGTINMLGLYGVVTTALGSNHTAAYWKLYDQTASISITLATGETLSSASVGSVILADVLAATKLTYLSAAAGAMKQPARVTDIAFSGAIFVQKTGSINTDIQYVYTTTSTPTSGAIQFFIRWLPLSIDGNITVV